MNEPTLLRAAESLSGALDRLVVVGGTAHRLFPMHALANAPVHELLTTEDVDFAAPLELAHDGSRELLDRLVAAGFREQVGGGDVGVHTYHADALGAGYVQFIAPLTGSGVERGGEQQRVLRFSGLVAERLRGVDLLLRQPWSLDLDTSAGSLAVRVVNPVAFLVQKLLLLAGPSRAGRGVGALDTAGASKRGKDLLYIHDTLAIFADSLEELGVASPEGIGPLSSKAANRLRRAVQRYCSAETDVSREAAAIARAQRDDPPDSKRIVSACGRGLGVVLGRVL